MTHLKELFPPQSTYSISEALCTDFPDFIPHHEVIFLGINDLFQTKIQSLSTSDQAYLDKLKGGSKDDKAIAAEIARWHNQTEFAKGCVDGVENNALCHRMLLMLNNVPTDAKENRKQITKDKEAEDYDDIYESSDEYKFVQLDYNLQTFGGSTSDPGAIENLMKAEAENMKKLLDSNKCSWRFHLIYAALLGRITLDSALVQQQIDLGMVCLNIT